MSKKKNSPEQASGADEQEMTYHQTTPPQKRGKATAIIIMVIALLLAGTGIYFYFFNGLTPGQILENVTIAGVDVGSMTKEEACSAVRSGIQDTYGSQDMVVHIDPYTVSIPADIADVTVDVEGAVEAAFNYGRKGSYTSRKAQQLTAQTVGHPVDLSPYLTVDTEAVYGRLEDFLFLFESELVQSSFALRGEKPDLSAPIGDVVPQTLVITKGTSLYELDMDGLYNAVLAAYQATTFQTQFQCSVTDPDELDIQSIYDEYCSQPVDAVMDPETFQITREFNGYDFDLEQTQEQFASLSQGKYIEVSFRLTAPEVTYQSLYDSLFQDELASYTAYQASSSDRATNLRLACEAINGTILYPGDTFSFNRIVGERTPEKGYRPAAAYVDGESVASYGGGVCQVASTIYYCCLYADLEIVERTWHMYPVSYVPYGMDATIYWGSLDYKFKNNFRYPVRIDITADGGSVTVHLMGTEEKDYYIDMEYAILEVLEPETKEVEMTADNPKGYKNGDVITTPHTGYHVRTYKYKYSKADDTLIDSATEADSHYRKRDKEVAKIPEPPAPTEPVPTDPVGVPGAVTPDG